MSTQVKPRPALKFGYKDLGLPKNTVVHRIETHRTKRRWFELWKPKYNIRLYALTNSAVYDITEAMK
jgi:hypothetical protein